MLNVQGIYDEFAGARNGLGNRRKTALLATWAIIPDRSAWQARLPAYHRLRSRTTCVISSTVRTTCAAVS